MSDFFLGEVRIFAGIYAPVNWAFCDGRLLSISDNDALFSLIGTTYGGDGQTTFALPDLRGRLPVGEGTGPGLTPRAMGEKFGTESVELAWLQLPAHNHNFVTTTAAAENAGPAGALFANTGGDALYVLSSDTPELKALNPKTVTSDGGGQPHDNIMPSLAMNYIISLTGIYPPKN